MNAKVLDGSVSVGIPYLKTKNYKWKHNPIVKKQEASLSAHSTVDLMLFKETRKLSPDDDHLLQMNMIGASVRQKAF